MKGSISIKTISFKNGTDLLLNEDSIVLFVGANNSGKSLLLRELESCFLTNNSGEQSRALISKIEGDKHGTYDDVLDNVKSRFNGGNQYSFPNGSGISLSDAQIKDFWQGDLSSYSSALAYPFFIKRLDTRDRLLLVDPPPRLSFGEQITNHPIQILQRDQAKEVEFSKIFRKAFNKDAIVNHNGGQTLPINVGERPESTKEHDRVSDKYSEELQKLGQLQNQGDGMKAFAGVFLNLFATNFSINLIDEPEAFLHPPQARLLGEMLAKTLGTNKQLFISSHSEHFLKGILNTADSRLIVVRLLRNESGTRTTILDNDSLKKIWKEPLLKHSNILDGLFHSRVVLCESEGDSRFFSAIASSIVEDTDLSSPDIHFVQCGGKHQFPTAINALKKLDVPLTVIADFDLLNNISPLREVFEALSGNWDKVKDDWKRVKEDIDAQRPELDAENLKKNIEEVLSKITTNIVSDANIKELESTIKKASAWGVAKKLGKRYVRAGDATSCYIRIDEAFKQVKLIVLDVGEIECFDKTVGNHGPKWVNAVLEKDLKKSTELNEAREFVSQYILQ